MQHSASIRFQSFSGSGVVVVVVVGMLDVVGQTFVLKFHPFLLWMTFQQLIF